MSLTPEQILKYVPQQRPMRFVDSLLEIDEEHILGGYTWNAEDCVGYRADGKLVPPFKLIEMAAQIGSVAWCIWLMSQELPIEEIQQLVGFFTELQRGEFLNPVHAGDRLLCQATFDEDGYFRKKKILTRVEMQFDGGPKDGETVFTGMVSGMWVPKSANDAA
jgi:3-hydroxymyristoyl/3-hydroxydecanoyl-(acyl carrier protein) dehydratase